jgi:hypothetical protein
VTTLEKNSWETSNILNLDLSKMEPIGENSENDPKTRLLGTIRINDVPFHVEALQIKRDKEEVQQAADPEMRDYFNEIYGAVGAEGPLYLIEYDGREYAIFVYPYCM